MLKVRLNLRNVVAIAICLAGVTFFGSCEKENKDSIDNPDNPSSGSLKVGQTYQGGIIAYVDNTGKHGFIATPEDISPGISWEREYALHIETGATGTMIGTGKSNTDKIVQVQGQGNYAAKLCYDLVFNGYDDWYLPSLNELDILYRNRNSIGMFQNDFYWSSSECFDYWGIVTSWSIDFSDNGRQYDYAGRQSTMRVRAIRSF